MKKIYNLFVLALLAIGAQAQITLVKDINPGTGNSSPANLFVFDGKIYFAADDASSDVDHGKELWVTDGATTVLVADIRTGSSNSTPSAFFTLNNTLFFSAIESSPNVQWKLDNNIPVKIADYNFYASNKKPAIQNNIVYFARWNDDFHLYKYDGTNEPAQLTNNTSSTINEYVSDLIVFGDKLLLYMKNANEDLSNIQGTEVGSELYQYDFATGNYTLVKNIAEDVYTSGSEDINSSGISNFTVLGDKVYFEAESNLWQTDGTTDGTIAVPSASNVTNVANFYAWDGKLFLEGDDGTNGDQLYVYDPSANTITMLSDIKDGLNVAKDHNPSDYAAPGDGYLYYKGQNEAGTVLLYRTDGTLIQSIYSSAVFTGFDELVVLNGILYFEATDGSTGNEFYMLDPSTITNDDIATALENDLEFIEPITVYPNPSNGTFNIKGLETADATYCIYSLTGQCVAKGNIFNNQLSYNKAGMYILQIMDGTNTLVQKITVK